MKASRLLCSKFEEISLAIRNTRGLLPMEPHGVSCATVSEVSGLPVSSASLDANLGIPTSDAEMDRAIHCAPHNLNLAVEDSFDVATDLSLRIGHMQAFAVVLKRNKTIRHLFQKCFDILKRDGKVRLYSSVKLKNDTRWNSALPLCRSYVQMYLPICKLYEQCVRITKNRKDFDVLLRVPLLNPQEYTEIEELVKVLEVIERVSIFFFSKKIICDSIPSPGHSGNVRATFRNERCHPLCLCSNVYRQVFIFHSYPFCPLFLLFSSSYFLCDSVSPDLCGGSGASLDLFKWFGGR